MVISAWFRLQFNKYHETELLFASVLRFGILTELAMQQILLPCIYMKSRN